LGSEELNLEDFCWKGESAQTSPERSGDRWENIFSLGIDFAHSAVVNYRITRKKNWGGGLLAA
jgi:hypothetical protein